ncbi:MAG: YccF domain-containing protein [Oscillospiraceae bacterium]
MSCLGNVIWFILGGLLLGISWAMVGLLWCLTIVGIPVGIQCFKFSALMFAPFGKSIAFGKSAGCVFLNVLWLMFGGLILAAESAAVGIVFALTIVGIPLSIQCFKFAKLALLPFGAKII